MEADMDYHTGRQVFVGFGGFMLFSGFLMF